MSELLEFAVAAQGGLTHWGQFRTLHAKMAIRGAIFEAKRIAGLQEDVSYEVQLHEERVTVHRFGGPDRRLRFRQNRLTLGIPRRLHLPRARKPARPLQATMPTRPGMHCISAISAATRCGPI